MHRTNEKVLKTLEKLIHNNFSRVDSPRILFLPKFLLSVLIIPYFVITTASNTNNYLQTIFSLEN
jgi:hypothetical protein